MHEVLENERLNQMCAGSKDVVLLFRLLLVL